jgi:hypothetical protein
MPLGFGVMTGPDQCGDLVHGEVRSVRPTTLSWAYVRISARPMPTWMLEWFSVAPCRDRSGSHWTCTPAPANAAFQPLPVNDRFGCDEDSL